MQTKTFLGKFHQIRDHAPQASKQARIDPLKYMYSMPLNFDKLSTGTVAQRASAQPLRKSHPPFPELWRRIPSVVPLYRNHRDPARLLLVPPRPWGLSSISSHSNVLASSPQSPLPSLVISVTLWCVFIVYQECCR